MATTDDYVDLIRNDKADYMGDTNGCADYMMKFTTDEDDKGVWSNVYFDIWVDEIPSDLSNIEIPPGTYTASPDHTAHTFDPEYTFVRIHGTDGNTVHTFVSGTIEINAEDAVYEIFGDFTDAEGNEYKYRYNGPITVGDESPHHLKLLTDNADVTFTEATALYSGDYYKNGTSLVNFTLTAGSSLLNVEFLTEGAEYSTTVLRPGSYTVRVDQTQGSILKGEEHNDAGWSYVPVGTYYKLSDGDDFYGFATEGTITVQLEGETYTLAIDLRTSNGKTVRGNYSGIPTFTDGTYVEPLSQLEEDRELDLSPITQGRMLYSGYWYGNGMNEWTIYLKNEDIDGIDGIYFDFNLPDRGYLPEGIPTGHYEMSAIAKENTMVPGFIDTYLAGSWYVWDNQYGMYTKSAPIASGFLDLSKEGEVWTIDFEVYDDAKPAHKIWGHWSGPMQLEGGE